ncbi:SDR family oxidoreductase [Desulfosoma sp.]
MEQVKGSVLISGASTGIGRATALLLDRQGYRVFAGVRSPEAAQQLSAQGSKRLSPVLLDVTKAEDIEGVYRLIGAQPDIQEHGLRGLVNNAGTVISGPLEFLPMEDARRQLEINLFGHMAVTQKFLPLLRQAKGRVINIGSTAAFFAAPFLGAYCASKYAMEAFTDSLRREVQWQGISVSLVEPGYTETPIWDKGYAHAEKVLGNHQSPLAEQYRKAFRRGKELLDRGRRMAIAPSKVAACILRALETPKPKRRYLVGVDTYILALGQRFLPDGLPDWFIRTFLFR